MRRATLFGLLLLLAPFATASAQAPGPYYARGTVYCASDLQGVTPPDSCWGYGSAVLLHDDGLHGDGAAGDGVYGADVTSNQPAGFHEFKIANADWSFGEPTVPAEPFVNGRVWTGGPGDVVHYSLSFASQGPDWLPEIAVANDHGYPAGAQLEVIGSPPELGSWNSGVLADHVGSIWEVRVTIATPGFHEFKFRVEGTWLVSNFGPDYNNNFGRNASFTTTEPDVEMLIQFDASTGRIRAIPAASTPTSHRSWGDLKSIYR